MNSAIGKGFGRCCNKREFSLINSSFGDLSILNTVLPLISARGAYKTEKWNYLFYFLISAPCSKSDKEWNTEKQNKMKDLG